MYKIVSKQIWILLLLWLKIHKNCCWLLLFTEETFWVLMKHFHEDDQHTEDVCDQVWHETRPAWLVRKKQINGSKVNIAMYNLLSFRWLTKHYFKSAQTELKNKCFVQQPVKQSHTEMFLCRYMPWSALTHSSNPNRPKEYHIISLHFNNYFKTMSLNICSKIMTKEAPMKVTFSS